MNSKSWTKEHTYGLLIGLATVIVAIPLVIFILSLVQGFSFKYLFKEFFISSTHKTKDISLACIANLLWFHFFLRREKWSYAYGVIAATFVFLFIIVYYKFLA